MSRIPNPRRTLTGELNKTREQVRRGSNASVFTGTGFHPNGQGGMDSDNYVEGEAGFSLRGADGYLEVNDVRIRGGIIGNDALSDPVVPEIVNELLVADFGLTAGTYTTLISLDLTPPAGATTGLVTLQGVVSALNTTASTDQQYASVVIGSSIGDGWGTACDPNWYNPAIGPHSALVTGITGTLTVTLRGQSGLNDWPSAPGKAKLTGSVLWLR